MTDPLGQSQVIPYMKGLAQMGYEITILSTEKKNNFTDKYNQIRKLLEISHIQWEQIIYSKTPPVLSTIYDIYKLKHKAKLLHKKNNFSIVHCRSYIASFAGLFLKKQYGIKFIFDMRGFYADERIDGSLWDLKNPLFNAVYKYFKRKEIEFLQYADFTVTLTNAAKEIIHAWPVFAENKPDIEIIPCCADLEHFSPDKIRYEDQEKLRNELHITKDNFILSYLGSLGTWYMADEMMQFFKYLLEIKSEAFFLIITPDNPEKILQISGKHGVPESSVIIRKAERNDVPLFLSLSNFSIFFIKPVFSKKASSPTKMGEIMGMGIPIICNAGVGDVDKIMNECNIGILIKDLNVQEMINGIKEIFQNTFLPSEIRNKAEGFYALSNGVKIYNSIYGKLLN